MAVKGEVKKKKSTAGAKTKYKKEYDKLAFNYCLLGSTDVEMANFFGVTEKTLNNWKHEHGSFFQSIKAGKEEADANVAKALYHRACGYSHKEDKIFNDNGKALVVETVKHYPPDTAAAINWLGNRQRNKWQRDPKPIEENETDTKPVKVVIEVADASRDKV